MNKLSKIIKNLPEKELLKIKRDLVSGNIDRIIEKKLFEINEEKYSEKQCPVCGGKITSESFIIEFGKPYIRRRAYFDGVDCLEYFVSNKIKQKQTYKI